MVIFLFTTASRPALEPTQPPIQWVPETFFLRIKRPVREADHSPPSSTEVKECVELYFHSPNMPSWGGAQLKHRDNFTLIFIRIYHQEQNQDGVMAFLLRADYPKLYVCLYDLIFILN
jgi:hypothetical protein